MTNRQHREDGSLQHLLTLQGLEPATVVALLDAGDAFIGHLEKSARPERLLAGKTVVNLFFEPSTRTRVAFEHAGKMLGADVINLDLETSSQLKGESLEDTVLTLVAMGVDALVVRHAETGTLARVAACCPDSVSVISAGESTVSHPTQGLLDTLTIRRHKSAWQDLAIAIVGDIAHSRVAASAVQAFTAVGVGDIRLVGPEDFLPGKNTFTGCSRFTDIEAGIKDCDVVMALRVQRERMAEDASMGGHTFFQQYGLTAERLKLAKTDAIVMHPGPMNRDVEIASSVADSKQSVIREQVRNGVAIRMAVLQTLLANGGRLANG